MYALTSYTHIKRIDTDEAKRMIVYAEKTKVKTHEQQPSHLTHVYFIAYSYTANQLLLWIYSLFIPSLSHIAHSFYAGFALHKRPIHIFAYLGLIVFHRQLESVVIVVVAAITPTHMGLCSVHACVCAFLLSIALLSLCSCVCVDVTKNERCV